MLEGRKTGAAPGRGARLLLAGVAIVVVAVVAAWFHFDVAPGSERGGEVAPEVDPPSGRTDSVDPETAEGAVRRAPLPAAAAGTASPPERSFSLRFLDARSYSPVAGVAWTFEAEGGEVLSRRTDENGTCALPVGRWTIEAEEAELFPIPEEIDGRDVQSTTIRVHRPDVLDLLVADELGSPVADARVVWTPAHPEPRGWSSRIPPRKSRTDELGRTSVELTPASVGTLAVAHPDYDAFRLEIARAPDELRVQLRPAAGSGRRVRFVGADHSRPLEGVRVRSEAAGLVGESDELGRVRIPAWAMAEDHLLLEGGCFPVVIAGADLDTEELALKRGSRVVLDLVPPLDAGESAAALPRWNEEDSGSVGSLELPEHVELDPERPVVDVPLGLPVSMRIVTTRGRSGTQDLLPSSGKESATVHLRLGPVLEVYAVDGAGEALREFRVRYHYDGEAEVAEAGSEGRALLPRPDLVRGFSVHAPGFVPAYARPTRLQAPTSPTADPSGSVTVELRRSNHDLDLRVVDRDGRPLAGYLVSVTDRRMFQAFHRFRELGGCWPTGHPAWLQAVEPEVSRVRTATTDADGRVTLHGLAAGPYGISTRIDRPRVSGDSIVAQVPASVTVDVPTEGVTDLLAFRMRPVLLRVREAYTGRPVPRFSVGSNARGLGRPSQGQGGLWQGWIQDGLDLELTAPRLAGSVPADRIEEGGEIEVTLEPEVPTVLALEGEVEGLAGETLHLQVRREALPEAVVWRTSLPVEDPGRPIPFYVPFEEGVLITIADVVADGSRWQLTPTGRDASEFRFTVQRTSTQ